MDLLQELALRQRILGDYFQLRWNKLLDIIGDDPMKLWVFGTALVVFMVFWSYAALFTLMDITNRPRFLRKYKIQPGQNEPVCKKRLCSAIKVVLINQFVVGLPMYYLIFLMGNRHLDNVKINHSNNNNEYFRELPSLQRVLLQMIGFVLIEEFMFYYAHRLLHHKSIYKYIHKKHHEWTAPIAIINFYCHPVEHIVANLLPVGVTLLLLRCHITTAWLFISLAIVNSMCDHTGYDFPWSPSSVRFHDYHHAKFNYNYGVLGWLDKLHGTYRDNSKIENNSTLPAIASKRLRSHKLRKQKTK